MQVIPSGMAKLINQVCHQVIYRQVFLRTLFSIGYGNLAKLNSIIPQAQNALSKYGVSSAPSFPEIISHNTVFEDHSFEDLPRMLELYFTTNVVGPLPKIASTKPRDVLNHGLVCYAISVYQAIVNFFPLIRPAYDISA